MKTRLIAIIILILYVCLTGLQSLAASEPVGKLVFLKGQVFVERNGERIQATVNDPVYLKDKWQTETGSSAEIAFLDDSRIRMASNTILEVTEFLYQPQEKTREGLMSLLAGKARFLVQEMQHYKHKQFRVKTQTAVVGTRDTDFLVWIKSLTETYALCLENTISLINSIQPDQEAILSAFMYSVVQGENPPSPPDFIPQDQLGSIIQELQEIGKKKDLIGSPPDPSQDDDQSTGSSSDTTTPTTTGTGQTDTTTETTTGQASGDTSTTTQNTTSTTEIQTTTTTTSPDTGTNTTAAQFLAPDT
ncbi:MAG: FecR family protein, partial [Desulfatirhabdiaceae bacterium]